MVLSSREILVVMDGLDIWRIKQDIAQQTVAVLL